MMTMEWKQPITTNALDLCHGDKFDTTVFILLLWRARNADGSFYLPNGDKVDLKRGQSFCGRYELAEFFGLNRNRAGKIQRSIDRLQNSHHLIDKQKTRNGSIISINNYDELVDVRRTNEQSIDHQQTIDRPTIDTNNSVNSVEIEKNDNNNPAVAVVLDSFKNEQGADPVGEVSKVREQAHSLAVQIHSLLDKKGIDPNKEENYRLAVKLCLKELEKQPFYESGVKSLTPLIKNVGTCLKKFMSPDSIYCYYFERKPIEKQPQTHETTTPIPNPIEYVPEYTAGDWLSKNGLESKPIMEGVKFIEWARKIKDLCGGDSELDQYINTDDREYNKPGSHKINVAYLEVWGIIEKHFESSKETK